jgi:SAM-dependent methyltransferase
MRASATRTPREAEELLAEVIVRTGSSDREATVQALLERLDLAPGDEVLEVGVGNGRLLAAVAARLARGRVTGIDVSEHTLRHARLRCGRFLAEGRVRLLLGRSDDLRAFDARFDRVYGVHVPYFWTDPARDLWEIRRALRPGGRLVLGYWPHETKCPRSRAGAERASASPALLERLVGASGFDAVESARTRDADRTLVWTVAQRAAD